jgi:CopG family nickel-responsive transcriptional regulator
MRPLVKETIMQGLVRFGVSIEEPLLTQFDESIQKKGYANRSDAIRALIRSMLFEKKAEENPNLEVIGTITLVYDHGSGDLPVRLTDLQHHYHKSIVSTLHVHFDEHNCLEVLVVKGSQGEVRAIAGSLIGTRGVWQGKLVINAEAEVHGHQASRGKHRKMT